MTANRIKTLQANTATVADAGEIFNAPAGAAMPAPDTVQDAPTHAANRSIKQVLGYALIKDFRQRLSNLAESYLAKSSEATA